MAEIYVNDTYTGIDVCDDLTECPEDAIWYRALGKIFWIGVKIGRMTKSDTEIRIEYKDPY